MTRSDLTPAPTFLPIAKAMTLAQFRFAPRHRRRWPFAVGHCPRRYSADSPHCRPLHQQSLHRCEWVRRSFFGPPGDDWTREPGSFEQRRSTGSHLRGHCPAYARDTPAEVLVWSLPCARAHLARVRTYVRVRGGGGARGTEIAQPPCETGESLAIAIDACDALRCAITPFSIAKDYALPRPGVR